MYLEYFGLKELPFSIAPDPRYLYMSERHREALAHLLFGVSGQGGFVLLTGEVGTGKTTTCRCFLDQVPDNTDVAFIVNPKLSSRELLASICDELELPYPESASIKKLNDVINEYLLNAHAVGRHTVLIIDEAQNLQVEVLEQLRLLTNLETSEKKLLQIVLLGQPELREILEQPELRQLAQRVTARYHLKALNKNEVHAYIKARLSIAGRRTPLFSKSALNKLYRLSKGIPRLINLISDRALLGAYATQAGFVEVSHVKQAYREIKGEKVRVKTKRSASKGFPGLHIISATGLAALLLAVSLLWKPEFLDRFEAISEFSVELPSIRDMLSSESPNEKVVEVNDNEGLLPKSQQATALESGAHAIDKSVSDLQVEEPALGLSAQNLNSDGDVSIFVNLQVDRMGRFKAFQALFERWGESYPEEPFKLACSFAESRGLGCLHKHGNWRSLFKLDRPAVLTLVSEEGLPFYAALLSVKDEMATISFRGKSHLLPLSDLDKYWLGEYSIVWKLPPYKLSKANQGASQDESAWLASQFMRLESPTTDEGVLIEPIEARIKRFQSELGLEPDGIAGTLTLIELNSKLNQNIPRLLGKAEEGESITVANVSQLVAEGVGE